MNELALTVINNWPIFVIQKIVKKLQHLPIKNLYIEILSKNGFDECDMTIYTVSEGDDIDDVEDIKKDEKEEIITESEII